MLKTVYATAEEIPEGYAALYTERNGQWELTGVTGIKTQSDVDRLSAALTKERNDHKATRQTLQAFGELDPEEVRTKLENYDNLNEQVEALKAGGAFDEEKMEPIIQSRVRQAIGPLEREKNTLQRQLDDTKKKVGEFEGTVSQLQQKMINDRIERAVRDTAVAEKVIAPAIGDAVLNARGIFEETEDGRIVTKDGVAGVTPGLTAKEWLNDMKEKAPHWWPSSVGGGSRGGGPLGQYQGADNPWSKEGWNLTKQGQIVKQVGLAKANEIAARVNSKVGATKPAAA